MRTRVVYSETNGMVVTGRMMDWKTDMHSNLWVFPRGTERNGEIGKDSLKRELKYDSITISAFEIASTNGMNEKGLVVNLLWLPEVQYPARDKNKSGLVITIWVQYMLDNFVTVEEAVSFINEDTSQAVSDKMPGGPHLATLHLSISDVTGDCAIFEYIGGKLTVYHSKEYKVMTNSPTYNKQLALCEYWKSIGGLSLLPGTNRAPDRFAGVNFYIDAALKTDDEKIATARVLSVIRNVSAPYSISASESPEIFTTQWRMVSEGKNLIYFFESSLTPNTFWVQLRDMDLPEGVPVLKLSTANGETYHGSTSRDFRSIQPFKFMGVKDLT